MMNDFAHNLGLNHVSRKNIVDHQPKRFCKQKKPPKTPTWSNFQHRYTGFGQIIYLHTKRFVLQISTLKLFNS